MIFLDIPLSDSLSFEVFNHINITCPLIFTTAYEKYAINQFISISYSTKDVYKRTLKYKVGQVMKLLASNYKSRFIVNVAMHIRPVELADIISYSGSRLKLKIVSSKDDDILVGRGKLAEFTRWLER